MADPIRGEYERVMVRLGELWLKGKNRGDFIERLRRNLASTLRATVTGASVERAHGRFFVRMTTPGTLERVMEVCADTPGIVWVSPVLRVPSEMEAIEAAALKLVETEWPDTDARFAVSARRTDKQFPLTSPQINQALGAAVAAASGRPVDLSDPEHKLGVEVNVQNTHLWARTRRGAGGLPVGSAGKALLLLSGGIDSPVAGYLAQKRGCALEAVYFHSPPFVSEASRDKVEDLARRLAPRQDGLRLHVVHFTEVQKAIRADCDPRFTVLLYRRFMYRIAHRLAAQRGALALCTGESLGQVASQTLENLNLVDRLGERMTMRPLLSYDKQEIMAIARRIETYETSILPYDDCCTLFVPKSPIIHGHLRHLERQEARLDVEALVDAAVGRVEAVKL